MRHVSILSFIIALLLFVPACSTKSINLGAKKASRVDAQTVESVEAAALHIDSRNGSVEVIVAEDEPHVSIQAVIRCTGATDEEAQARLDGTKLLVEHGADGTLIVRPIFPDKPRGGDGADITLRAPIIDGAVIDTSNGRVTVSGTSGSLTIDTSNGEVIVHGHTGGAYVDTSNGNVTVHDIAGDLEVDTSNGSVMAKNVDGELFVDTSNGNVQAINIAGAAEIDTSNGEVLVILRDDQTGPLIVDTSNGTITANVGEAFIGSVRFDTTNGNITIHDPKQRVTSNTVKKTDGEITVGEGGEASVLDTTNASIALLIAANES